MKVKRGYNRKLNLSKYGGNQYETADFYCELEQEAQYGQEKEVSRNLIKQCQQDVEESIEAMKKTLKDEQYKADTKDLDEAFKELGRK